MSALPLDMRFEHAHMLIGERMSDPEWINEAWGYKADCDKLFREMSTALADGDDAQVGAILRNELMKIATREAEETFRVSL